MLTFENTHHFCRLFGTNRGLCAGEEECKEPFPFASLDSSSGSKFSIVNVANLFENIRSTWIVICTELFLNARKALLVSLAWGHIGYLVAVKALLTWSLFLSCEIEVMMHLFLSIECLFSLFRLNSPGSSLSWFVQAACSLSTKAGGTPGGYCNE